MASTVWRGFITFGLISIPVRLFRAARAERVSLRRLYRAEPRLDTADADGAEPDTERAPVRKALTGQTTERSVTTAGAPASPALTAQALAPLRQAAMRKDTDEVVPEKAVVKGYEYEKDRFVALEAEDLKSIVPKTATEMQIEEFVNLAEVDPVYFETSYYVVPEEAGRKAYALLYRSLQMSGLVAVAQLAMHGREHVVIVRPGGKGVIAHTMFFSSEVRADEEYPADLRKVSEKELELAQTLIHSLAAPFEPEKYHDAYREKLEAMIARKVAGEPVQREVEPARPAAVVDIAEALKKSIAALKKPAASEKQTRTEANISATTRKKTRRSAAG